MKLSKAAIRCRNLQALRVQAILALHTHPPQPHANIHTYTHIWQAIRSCVGRA